MPKVMNFNENLEKGLAKIGERIAVDIERPEMRGLPEREVIKKSIQSIAETISQVVVPQSTSHTTPSHLPTYMSDGATTDEVKQAVEHLVSIALDDNLEKAVKESKKYPAFIEDAFHDALVDKLVPELKRKGVLG